MKYAREEVGSAHAMTMHSVIMSQLILRKVFLSFPFQPRYLYENKKQYPWGNVFFAEFLRTGLICAGTYTLVRSALGFVSTFGGKARNAARIQVVTVHADEKQIGQIQIGQ